MHIQRATLKSAQTTTNMKQRRMFVGDSRVKPGNDRIFLVLLILLPLLFTSCLAEFLNEKFGFNHPLYIKYDIFDGVSSDDTKKVYPGYALTAEDVKTPENPYDMSNPFLGWFLEPTYINQVHEGFVVNEDITLYGRWTNDYRYHPNENLYIFESYVLDYTQSTDFQLISSEMATGLASYIPQETIGNNILIQGAEETHTEYNYPYNGITYSKAIITKLKYYNPEIGVDDFLNLLTALPDNSTDYTYYIKLTGNSQFFPSSDYFNYTGSKMIHLDLSGYTCQSFSSSETFTGKLWLREISLNFATGSQTFKNCSKLEKANLLSGVDSIGNGAFSECSSLKEIIIPSGPTQISQSAFYNCSSLTTVFIPKSVTTITSQAFAGCSSLVTIYIPNTVTTIQSNAFSGITPANLTAYYSGTQEELEALFLTCEDNNIKNAQWETDKDSYWD